MGTDYTRCLGKECPVKEKCYRFIGPLEPFYQSYFVEIPGKWVISDDPRHVQNGTILNEVVWKCDNPSRDFIGQELKALRQKYGNYGRK